MSRRFKDTEWDLGVFADNTVTNDDARLSVLMDLRDVVKEVRDELRVLNNVLRCPRNTAKRRRASK